MQRANGCAWMTVCPSGISTARASLCPLLATKKLAGMGTAVSVGPLTAQRSPPLQPAPLWARSTIGALGSMTMMSWSEVRVWTVGRAMLAGTYAAPRPIGMFQMLLLAKGQRSLLRVPAGAGLGVGLGVGLGLGVAVAVAVAAGVLAPAGLDAGVGPSVALGVAPPEDVRLTARCVAAGPHATMMSIA